jgi:SAM-dependent methyltransferase
MLVYPQIRKALIDSSVGYVRVALHAAEAHVHDGLVRVVGAHAQVMTGLGRLLEEGDGQMRVDVACTVTAKNLEQLDRLVEALVEMPRRAQLAVRFVAPIGGMDEDEWPDGVQAATRVVEALSLVRVAGADVIGAWEGYPPCLMEGVAQLRDEILRYGALAYGPAHAGTALPEERAGSRAHPFPCQECIHESTCPGPPQSFLARQGEKALRPVRSVRANSFNFEKVRTIAGLQIRAGDCEVKSLVLQGARVRHLVLHHEGHADLYRSDTGDFTDTEIARIRDELEQVYLDQHDQGTLQEFLQAVRRVRNHAECLRCPDRARCCGAVEVDSEPAFEREERWIRKEISRMRGRVLDVGCGDQLYRELLVPLIAEGKIDYHGVDPDGEALERMRAAGVGGTLHHGEIETFVFAKGYFDYVLALRSLNHFRDMERAFHVIARVMRPQGQFVLCDSLAYGLLRTRKQARYADENAPVGHEHWRNWSSQQVVEFGRRFPLRVDVHRPVGPQGCNQWIVKFMRTADDLGPEGAG